MGVGCIVQHCTILNWYTVLNINYIESPTQSSKYKYITLHISQISDKIRLNSILTKQSYQVELMFYVTICCKCNIKHQGQIRENCFVPCMVCM